MSENRGSSGVFDTRKETITIFQQQIMGLFLNDLFDQASVFVWF